MVTDDSVFRTSDKYLAGLLIYLGYDIHNMKLESMRTGPGSFYLFTFVFPVCEGFSFERMNGLAGDFYASKLQVEALSYAQATKRAHGLLVSVLRQTKSAAGDRE